MDTATKFGTSGGKGAAIDETDRLIASDKVEGTAVYNRDGDRLGSVHTVRINKSSVAYLVIPPRRCRSGTPFPRNGEEGP